MRFIANLWLNVDNFLPEKLKDKRLSFFAYAKKEVTYQREKEK